MTKEELLKIYGAYSPYKLHILHTERKIRLIISGAYFNENSETNIQLKLLNWDTKVNSDEAKPILYDLSYLTKEIEHEGSTIIPIVELAKIGTGEQECGVTNSNLGTCYVNSKNEKKGFFIYHPGGYFIWQVGKNSEPLIVKNQLKLFQKLFEYHFNVFQLPESEYINKATICKD